MSTNNRYKIRLQTENLNSPANKATLGFRTLKEIDIVLEKYNVHRIDAWWPYIELIPTDDPEIRLIVKVSENEALIAFNAIKTIRRLNRNDRPRKIVQRRTKRQIIIDRLYPDGMPKPPVINFVDTSRPEEKRPFIKLTHSSCKHVIVYDDVESMNKAVEALYDYYDKNFKSTLNYRRLSHKSVEIELKRIDTYSAVFAFLDELKT